MKMTMEACASRRNGASSSFAVSGMEMRKCLQESSVTKAVIAGAF